MRKVSNKEMKYLSFQKIDKTWRQFYEEIYGNNIPWMETTVFGGSWLEQKMNEPLNYPNINGNKEHSSTLG